MKKKIIVTLLLIMNISCTKQEFGTGIGAVTGTLIGSTVGKGDGRVVAMLLGTVAGAAVGNSIGQSLDEADKHMYASTSKQTFETFKTGDTNNWRNPDSGNSGSITVEKTYREPKHGRYCREFSQTIIVGGKQQQGYGTACRQPDGDWKISQ